MGRFKTEAAVLRPEVRLLKEHAATKRLVCEARARDVSLAQHIHDLLIAREAALSGQEYNHLLWVPSAPPAPEEDRLGDAPTPEARGASAAAAAWLKRRSS